MKHLGMFALVTLLLPVAAAAQQDSATMRNPITSLLKHQVAQYGGYEVGAAEAMPADKYNFKPTPEMRTFAGTVLHIAQFNNLACSRVSGMTAPDIKDVKETDGKDKLVPVIKASFDFCTMALSNLDDSTLGMSAGKMGPNNLSRGGLLVILGEDWFDHYSAEATYLRLNGILPPSAQPKK